MKKFCALLIVFGCGSDGEDVDGKNIVIEAATMSECPSGGVVLIDSGERYPICNGSDVGVQGPQGPMGLPGAMGPAGLPGPMGASYGSSNIISRTVLCQATDPVLLISLSAYIWVIDVAADSNDNIGICSISEIQSAHTETAPIIGAVCNLPSFDAGGVVTIDFTVSPPIIGGVLTGQMQCL